MQYLECDGSNFEIYSVTDRKPVEISKNRRNVAKTRLLGNDPSKCVLDKLQTSQIRNRSASKERVTVVESRTQRDSPESELCSIADSANRASVSFPRL